MAGGFHRFPGSVGARIPHSYAGVSGSPPAWAGLGTPREQVAQTALNLGRPLGLLWYWVSEISDSSS